MKKPIFFLTFLTGILITFSLFGAFERLRNFFTGRRYYYYDDGYYYYPSGKRYYYYTKPRTRHYYEPVYYYYEPISKVPYSIHDGRTTITQDAQNYTITVTLPGYAKSDIHVSALARSIRINARPSQKDGIAQQLPALEQTIPLKEFIKPEAVTSQYENGILTLTAPKLYPQQGVAVTVE